jgi:hypothetical protein
MVVYNPENLIGSCRLYYLTSRHPGQYDEEMLTGVLNGTLVGFWRNFYGRYTGMEGSLDTMVVDVNLLEVPDPRNANSQTINDIIEAFRSMCNRPIGQFVAEDLMECNSAVKARTLAEAGTVLPEEFLQADRRQLDDAVFKLLGVESAETRRLLLDRLYQETAEYFRRVRVTELEKMGQRAGSVGPSRYTTEELATDIWDALEDFDTEPFTDWWSKQVGGTGTVFIPAERPSFLNTEQHMFDAQRIYFGKARKLFLDCSSRTQAELVDFLANVGLAGNVPIPQDESICQKMSKSATQRIDAAEARLEELAATRIGDDELRKDVLGLLMNWYIQGHVSKALEQPSKQ